MVFYMCVFYFGPITLQVFIYFFKKTLFSDFKFGHAESQPFRLAVNPKTAGRAENPCLNAAMPSGFQYSK